MRYSKTSKVKVPKVKGSGFDSTSGGFTTIWIDGTPHTASAVANAVAFADKVPWSRPVLGEKIARAIAPEAWAERDEGMKNVVNGKISMTNMSYWKWEDSLGQASRVLDLLTDLGFPIKPKKKQRKGVKR